MEKTSEARPRSLPRPSGLGTLAFLVLLGVGVTAGYMQWKAPEVHAIVEGRKREVAEVPLTPAERLVHWLRFGNAMMHKRLEQMRFSAEQPWLVTHAVAPASADTKSPSSGPEGLEIFGIDLTEMPRELGRVQGLAVVVRLPRARSLGHGELTGDNAQFVPIVHDSLTDADARARDLVAWALRDLGNALQRDIPGAHLSIEVGPESSWSELLAARPREVVESPAQAPRKD